MPFIFKDILNKLSMKIGLLIPSTSNGREWTNIKESYLYELTFKTFLLTQNPEHEYVFYIGIDRGDKIYDTPQKDELLRFKLIFKNVDIQFIYMDCKKGHLTRMWNILFQRAYDEECDYFYQCGDDIKFHTKGWVNDSISTLIANKNIGITGPTNNNHFILTQVFVSRKHMEIFGHFFPEEIINWGCDDWYNWVYRPNYSFPLKTHYCSNEGGKPRYAIHNNPYFMDDYKKNVDKLRKNSKELAESHKCLIEKYLKG
jgi:hypothetical protein